jgi:hypothetical protein
MSQANSVSTKTGIDRRMAIIDIAKPYRFERITNYRYLIQTGGKR